MDLAPAFRALMANKGWVLLALVFACVVGLLVGFRVSLSPPSVKTRADQYGTATTKVLVDTRPSTLTDSGFSYDPLITRANVYSQLVSTAPVRRLIARYSGIPSDQIVTNVPSNAQQITNQPRQNRGSGSTERATEVSSEGSSFRLDIAVEENLPIISVAAQAPEQDQALRLANGAAQGLSEYIRTLRPDRARGREVEVRRLGNAASGTAGGSTGLIAAAGISAAVFILLCLVIVSVTRMGRGGPSDPEMYYWDELVTPQLPPPPTSAPEPIPDRADRGARRAPDNLDVH